MRLLIEKGADLDALDDKERNAICYSITSMNEEAMALLLAKNAPFETQSR